MVEDPVPAGVASTALFVELLVIGAGTAAGLAPILAAWVRWGWLDRLTDIGPLVFFLIAGVYVLGIITDRVADAVGEPLAQRWRLTSYPADAIPARDYESDLLVVLQVSPLASRLAYGRSRLRVCRGWALNSVIAAIAFLVYVLTAPHVHDRVALGICGEIAIVVLGVGCVFAWYRLAVAQYAHVRFQAGAG